MCLIAFAIGVHPSCPLLLAGNRDEFFDRPTAALHRWPDASTGIWAGRDQRDGGTWLGVSEAGRVALLTNVRSAQPGPGARSRGELATRWLHGEADVDAFAAGLDPTAYGGFNLVLGDLNGGGWTWLCNRDPKAPHTDHAPAALHRQDLTPGIYGVSNAALDTPWPKTQRLKTALAQAVNALDTDQDWLPPLQAALANDQPLPPHDLPETGVPADWERALSSPFVRAPDRGYGTRSSLVMLVQAGPTGHRADLHEWTHTPAGWSTSAPNRHRLSW